MATQKITESTPLAQVIKEVMQANGGKMNLDELTLTVSSSWGRDFTNSPYSDHAFVYKMAMNVVGCEMSLEKFDGKTPVIEREEGLERQVFLSPRLNATDLNLASEILKQVDLVMA